MTLSTFSMKNKAIVITAVVLLMLWGSLAYTSMPRRENPEFTVKVCQILTVWPGTPADKVEELVTAPIEAEVNTLENLRWIYSESSVGRSAVFVELTRELPPDEVDQMWDKVRARVRRVNLPDPDLFPIVNDDFGDESVMMLALYQEPLPGEDAVRPENEYSSRDLEIFANRLKDDLLLVPGVAKVFTSGVRTEAIYVETDMGNWSQLGLTSNVLQQMISRRNVVAPGGTLDTDVGRFSVKPSGDIDAVRQIESIVAGKAGYGEVSVPVYLDDLGITVKRGYRDPPDTICRFGDPKLSAPAVIVHFTMQDGANVEVVCAKALETVEQLTEIDRIFPPDIRVEPVLNASETVTLKISQFAGNVVGAILIVVVVVFLMVGLRSASVMAANIPLVIIGSLALIPLFGVQLEQISLAAMIIALGMLVDNAVQICDQTRRLQTEGLSPARAAVDGANELAFPIFIATMTTVAAFFPMLIGLKGSQREYVYSLPVTITVVLLLSYVLAMTFCVLLASWFVRAPADPNASMSPVVRLWQWLTSRLKKKDSGPKKPNRFKNLYPALSRATLRVKWPTVIVSFALLGFVLMLPVGSEFFPDDERDQFAVEVWLPEGASIEQTDNAAQRVESLIQRLSPAVAEDGTPIERLRNMRTLVGGGGARWYLGRAPEAPKPNYAEILVHTLDGKVTNDYLADVRRVAEEGDAELEIEPVDGVRVIPRTLELGPGVPSPIEIRIFGPRLGSGFADATILRGLARDLSDIMRKQPGIWDVYDSWGSDAYQLYVKVNPDKANVAGVTNDSVARTLNAYFTGHRLTTFREEDHQIPVFLRLPPEQRATVAGVEEAYVEGLSGKVPLDSIATVEARWSPAKIDRRYLLRRIDVRGRPEDGFLANDLVAATLATDEFKDWEASLPPGYWWEVGGTLYESNLTAADLEISIVISLLAIVLLLVIQFNGFVKPIIIIATLPLALIGALLGLFVMDYPLGFMPQLGLLSLFGIVVNAAIIYIDFADRLIADKIAEGKDAGPVAGLTREAFRDCLVKAGQVRLLPIAMTTLTTIGGLLPLGIAGGPLWEGMAWLMIFGLTIATLLTLIVVPALYAIFAETFGVKMVTVEAAEPRAATT